MVFDNVQVFDRDSEGSAIRVSCDPPGEVSSIPAAHSTS